MRRIQFYFFTRERQPGIAALAQGFSSFAGENDPARTAGNAVCAIPPKLLRYPTSFAQFLMLFIGQVAITVKPFLPYMAEVGQPDNLIETGRSNVIRSNIMLRFLFH